MRETAEMMSEFSTINSQAEKCHLATECFNVIEDPVSIARKVEEANGTVGCMIANETDAFTICDPLCADCPIVGVSKGFSDLTGHSISDTLGMNCRMLVKDVPSVAISKSSRTDVRSFVKMARLRNVDEICEVASLQANIHKDGTFFLNFFMICRVVVHGQPYLLGLLRKVGEGLTARHTGAELEQTTESSRAALRRLVHQMQLQSTSALPPALTAVKPEESLSWYSGRLQHHSVLLNGGRTAMRREPEQIASGCLVYSNQSIRHTDIGLSFGVRIDEVGSHFQGLPLLGFTRRKPTDSTDLHPHAARCLGASILVGACGEAFRRDKENHFTMGFKLPPQEEIGQWSCQPELPSHKRSAPVRVQVGDVLGCVCTHGGRIQMWLNDELVLDFHTGKPLDAKADYYATADVCLSVSCLSLVAWQPPEIPITQAIDEERLDFEEISKAQKTTTTLPLLGAALASIAIIIAGSALCRKH